MRKIAAIQMNSKAEVDENLSKISTLVKQAKKEGAAVVVLPENVAIMGKVETDKFAVAEMPGKGPIQDFLSDLAKHLDVWLIGGTLPIRAKDHRVFARSYVWNNQGQAIAHYDKIHLFDVKVSPGIEEYLESETLYPGDHNNLVMVETPIGKIGMSVCYDLRFPELFRSLFSMGAEILLVPAAFTAITGKAHWEPLLRARAIENFCYVVAPNQTGTHANGRATYGHSMIIDPWGSIVGILEEGEGIITAEIDLEKQREIRNRIPVSLHRRIK